MLNNPYLLYMVLYFYPCTPCFTGVIEESPTGPPAARAASEPGWSAAEGVHCSVPDGENALSYAVSMCHAFVPHTGKILFLTLRALIARSMHC